MSIELLISVFVAAVQCGTPILFATLGEIITERAGVLNLGVEGMMAMGAFISFFVAYTTGNIWLATLAGGLIASLLALLHGLVCIDFQGNQVVSGLALTILSTNLSNYLGTPLLGTISEGFKPFKLPILGDIPYIGTIFFQHDALVYVSYILPFALWFFLERTRYGLHLRAVGEYPYAAIAVGINPNTIRYTALFAGGFLIGMGGAYLSLSYTHLWANNLVAGRGWIAIALVIFAFWQPIRAVFGVYFFGGVMAFQLRLQASGTSIPSSILLMLPYALTIIALFFSSKKRKRFASPKALGINLEPRE